MTFKARIRQAIKLARKGRLDINQFIEQLAAEYSATQALVEQQVISALMKGDIKTAIGRQRELRKIRQVLDLLDKRTEGQTRRIARESIKLGERTVKTAAGENTRSDIGIIRRQSLDLVESNLNKRLNDLTTLIGRKVNDVFRQEGLRAAAMALQSGNESLLPAQEALRARLQRQGITSFVDARGVPWDLQRYARMHVRTVVTEAMGLGAQAAMVSRDLDLVDVISGETACAICEPIVQGGPYSLSGRATDHPKLEKLPHYHPECDCTILPNVGAFAEREVARAAA